MGIWDNVKSRLGMGDRYDRHGGRGDDAYGDEAYDEGAYDEGDYDDEAYDDEGYEDEGYEGYDVRPAPMRSYGVDRADYYNDNHAPLVSQSDVRSQPIPVVPTSGQARDRIPAPRAYRRSGDNLARPASTEDIYAFKDGLARQSGSLAQLQSQRLRMEDTGRLTPVGGPSASDAAFNASAQPAVFDDQGNNGWAQQGNVVDASTRFGQGADPRAGFGQGQSQGQVRARVHRRIEYVRPMTYADAEQVAQDSKRGVIVVLDLRTTRPELAKRILDFSFGVASALDGQVDRHMDRVYVFTCNGALTDEERAAIRV
jgi:cell division inhibitor SepF